MTDTSRNRELEALFTARGDALLATAGLLTGSRSAAEDLLQEGLERLIRHWRKVQDDPEGYLRRTMYNLVIDDWRRTRRRPEVLGDSEPPQVPDDADGVTLRSALVQALALLPPRQRAVLVLRFWEQRSETEAAELLGCSIGTVKSTASRGLARLRELTPPDWFFSDTQGPQARIEEGAIR